MNMSISELTPSMAIAHTVALWETAGDDRSWERAVGGTICLYEVEKAQGLDEDTAWGEVNRLLADARLNLAGGLS